MIKELALLFLKLGVFAFGGPAAHTAMMNEEVVVKRKWFTQEEFIDLMSFTNLIPGPNSTELAILIGYKKAGILGLLVAGISFIIPAVMIVLVFTMIYMSYQSVPAIQNVLEGMIPVMITIIAMASLKIGKSTMKEHENWIILILSLVMLLMGTNEFIVLVSAGLLKLLLSQKDKFLGVEPFSFMMLFLMFVKIGALLYGSGYVLISFVQSTFVDQLGWLNQSELMNLVMIGEITPGPLFTTATAIGYYLGGSFGALLATVGIFIPSFALIALVYPFYEKLKARKNIQIVIKGIGIASLAIMLNVVISLTIGISSNVLSMIILVFMLLVSYKYKVNSILLIVVGGLLGLILF